MQLNPDCVRDILLELEKQSYPTDCTIETLSNSLPVYNTEEINYCCIKLLEAKYIDAGTRNIRHSNGLSITSIYDITFQGHEFLNSVRPDNIWDNVKTIGTKIGATSLSSIVQIANGVLTAIIKNQLGF